jgi:hypothetical protein
MLFNLPVVVQIEILTKWLIKRPKPLWISLVNLDSAVCNKDLRAFYLSLLKSEIFVISSSLKCTGYNELEKWILQKQIKIMQLTFTGNEFSHLFIPEHISRLNVKKVRALAVDNKTDQKVRIINSSLGLLINRCTSLGGCYFEGCTDKNNLLWPIVINERLIKLTSIILDECSPTFNFYAIKTIVQSCRNLVEFALIRPMSPHQQKSYLIKESNLILIIEQNPHLNKVAINHKTFSSDIVHSLSGLKYLRYLELASSHPLLFNSNRIIDLITPIIISMAIWTQKSKHFKFNNFAGEGKQVELINWTCVECEDFFQQVKGLIHIRMRNVLFQDFNHVFKTIATNNHRTLLSLDVDSCVSKIFLKPFLEVPIFRLLMHNCVNELTSGVVLRVDDSEYLIAIINTKCIDDELDFFQSHKFVLMRSKMSDGLYKLVLKQADKIDVLINSDSEDFNNVLKEMYIYVID